MVAVANCRRSIDHPWTPDQQREYVAGLSEQETFHVAADGAPTGTVGYQAIDRWSPAGTFILPESRGRGVGKQLWSATEAFARAVGYRKLAIQVRASNVDEHRF